MPALATRKGSSDTSDASALPSPATATARISAVLPAVATSGVHCARPLPKRSSVWLLAMVCQDRPLSRLASRLTRVALSPPGTRRRISKPLISGPQPVVELVSRSRLMPLPPVAVTLNSLITALRTAPASARMSNLLCTVVPLNTMSNWRRPGFA